MDPSTEFKPGSAVFFIYILISLLNTMLLRQHVAVCVFLGWKNFKEEKQYHSKKLLTY